MRSHLRLVLVSILMLEPIAPARAQAPPTPDEVLGYRLGDRFTDAAGVATYVQVLARSSAKVEVRQYGATPEGRPLLLAIVAAPENLRRLDALLASNARLVDPRLPAEEAARIARSNPAVVWLTYGLHGDEASSSEAALWTTHALASGEGEAEGVLDSVVVVIDPSANPDGRERYVQWYLGARGRDPNPEPLSWEHAPPWPGGRSNHYLFDLNRDWTWATQPETRARLREWNRWNPQVHIDFHEMGYGSTYFFFPAADPVNPIYPDFTVRWAEYFGSSNAAEFDRRRWLYYSRERFDLFYPGYGDSWPSLVGAIGMTYEQAGGGAAGLVVKRPDGVLLTLADRATHHRVAGLTTLRAVMRRKTDLLMEFAAFHRNVSAGLDDVLLVPGRDPATARALVELLHAQGIRVERASRPFRASARPHAEFAPREEFPVGTLRVPARQPRGRLAITLLQPATAYDTTAGASYDITAWSLPYAFGVEAHSAGGSLDGGFQPLEVLSPAGTGETRAEDAYGYLVPPGFPSAGPVYRYVADGGRATALAGPIEAESGSWPAGTWFLPWDRGAPERLESAGLSSIAVPVHTGRTPAGRDLGTELSLALVPPRIGVIVGDGLHPASYGAVWFLLEQLADIPFDAIPAGSLGDGLLAPYDVLVLPDGSPQRALGDAGCTAIDAWVRAGGTLVAFARSAGWAGEMLAVVARRGDREREAQEEERRQRGLRTREQRRSDAWDDAVTGVILPARVDETHPLAWGTGLGDDPGRSFVLHLEDLVFEPDEKVETVVSFEAGTRAVSGVISAAKLEELSASSWLVTAEVGAGRAILFADDPLFRLMWYANFALVTNAVLFGPLLR